MKLSLPQEGAVLKEKNQNSLKFELTNFQKSENSMFMRVNVFNFGTICRVCSVSDDISGFVSSQWFC